MRVRLELGAERIEQSVLHIQRKFPRAFKGLEEQQRRGYLCVRQTCAIRNCVCQAECGESLAFGRENVEISKRRASSRSERTNWRDRCENDSFQFGKLGNQKGRKTCRQTEGAADQSRAEDAAQVSEILLQEQRHWGRLELGERNATELGSVQRAAQRVSEFVGLCGSAKGARRNVQETDRRRSNDVQRSGEGLLRDRRVLKGADDFAGNGRKQDLERHGDAQLDPALPFVCHERLGQSVRNFENVRVSPFGSERSDFGDFALLFAQTASLRRGRHPVRPHVQDRVDNFSTKRGSTHQCIPTIFVICIHIRVAFKGSSTSASGFTHTML